MHTTARIRGRKRDASVDGDGDAEPTSARGPPSPTTASIYGPGPSQALLDLLRAGDAQRASFSLENSTAFVEQSAVHSSEDPSSTFDAGAGVGLHLLHEASSSRHSEGVEQSAGSHRYGLRSHDGHSHGADGSCVIDGTEHARADIDAANAAAEADDAASVIESVEYIVPASVTFPKPLVIRPPPWWRPLVRSPLLWAVALLLLAAAGGIWAAGGPENAAEIARRTWLTLAPPPPPGLSPVRRRRVSGERGRGARL